MGISSDTPPQPSDISPTEWRLQNLKGVMMVISSTLPPFAPPALMDIPQLEPGFVLKHLRSQTPLLPPTLRNASLELYLANPAKWVTILFRLIPQMLITSETR